MRSLRAVLIVLLLVGCGRINLPSGDVTPTSRTTAPTTTTVVRKKCDVRQPRTCTAAELRAFAAFVQALKLMEAERALMASAPWPCIAVAETSNVPAMGPTYWTEYGVVVDIIEDFGTAAERAAIFGGYADAITRWRPVSRFAAVHGFGGWGVRTKQVCGL